MSYFATRRLRTLGLPALVTLAAVSGLHAQTAITGNYSQNFDSIGSGLPTSWNVYTGASATAIGTAAAFTTTATNWDSSTGRFSNYSSDNIANGSSATEQAANTDRALGVRQTGSLGDPGASFAFNFSTINATVTSLSIDLMTLFENTRTTEWSIQYGVGSNPTAYTTLGTYTTGTFGGTTFTYSTTDFGTALNNQSSVWFRVVALTASTGTGSRDTTAIDNFSLAATYIAPSTVTWTGTGSGATWADGTQGHLAANYTNSLTDSVSFEGLAETVTTSGTLQAGGMTFNASDSLAYTVAGTGLTLGAIGVTTTTDAVISAPIAGSNGLTKNGAANLTLSGTNTFTGPVTISGGKLIIAADANLGDATNSVILNNGTLKPTGDMTLAATRTLSGSGTLEIGEGNTLTLQGPVNATSITLPNASKLVLAGDSNSIASLTINAASEVSVTGTALGITAGITTTQTSGTVVVSGNGVNLGTAGRLFTVADGSADTDLLISAPLFSSSSGRIQKRGAGTLELAGDNSAFIGIQLGAQGSTPAEGGRILLSTENALGTGQTQANYGTLEAKVPVIAASISIGGRSNGFVTFAGSDMTFTGSGATSTTANSFFKSTATTGDLRFNVNNHTTFDGTFAASSGSGTSSNILVGGTGTLVIGGDASVITEKWVTQDTLTFTLSSLGKLGSGGLEIGATSTLVLTINSATEYSSGTGSLIMGNGGKLIITLNTTDIGTWTFFTGGGSGTYTDISLTGSAYGDLAFTNSGGTTWTATSGDVTFTYDTATATLAVPEPKIYALLGLGAAMMIFQMRRRTSSSRLS